MPRVAQNRIRCALDPGKKTTPFTDVLNDSSTLIVFKDTAFVIEFAIFNGASLYDLANIVSLTCLIAQAGTAAINPAAHTLSQSDLNNALTLDLWKNNEGGSEHGTFAFSDTETAIAAGDYDVTIYGITDKGRMVFGVSKLKVVDRKITSYLAAPPPGVTYATVADLAALNKQAVKYGVNPPGKFPIIVNEDSSAGTALRTGADGEFAPEKINNP